MWPVIRLRRDPRHDGDVSTSVCGLEATVFRAQPSRHSISRSHEIQAAVGRCGMDPNSSENDVVKLVTARGFSTSNAAFNGQFPRITRFPTAFHHGFVSQIKDPRTYFRSHLRDLTMEQPLQGKQTRI